MMLLATVLLPLALASQVEAAPSPEPAAPPMAVRATDVPGPSSEAAPHLDAGLAAFKKRRFGAARGEFEKAVTADPQSAAAHFYLGYTFYKLGEPSKRMNADKEKAKELFAKAFSLDPAFNPDWGRKK
jgi:Tfp pilus assembly protein PilF